MLLSSRPIAAPESFASCVTDPEYARVKLLLHMQGIAGGSQITDSSSVARVPSLISDCGTVKSPVKFGTSSGCALSIFARLDYAASANLAHLGTFTFDFWIHLLVAPTETKVFLGYRNVFQKYFILSTARVLSYYNGSVSVVFGTIPLNAWSYIALTQDGTNLKAWVNGVEIATTTSINAGGPASPEIGVFQASDRTTQALVNCALSEIRFTEGFARNIPTEFAAATAQWCPAVDAPTVDACAVDPDFASVILLLHADPASANVSIVKDSSNYDHAITLSNTAFSYNTANKKFGTALNLPSTQLKVPASPSALFKLDGSYTISGWVYVTGLQTLFILEDPATPGFSIKIVYGAVAQKFTLSIGYEWGVPSASNFPAVNQWYHVAVVRAGAGEPQMWINGTYQCATVSSAGYSTNSCFFLNQVLVDEWRITKGVVRDIAAEYAATQPWCTQVGISFPSNNKSAAVVGLRATTVRGNLGLAVSVNSAPLVGLLTTMRAGVLKLTADAVKNLTGIRMGARPGSVGALAYGPVTLYDTGHQLFENWQQSGDNISTYGGQTSVLTFNPDGTGTVFSTFRSGDVGGPSLRALANWADPATVVANAGVQYELFLYVSGGYNGSSAMFLGTNLTYDAARQGYVGDLAQDRTVSLAYNITFPWISITYAITAKASDSFPISGVIGRGTITMSNAIGFTGAG